MIHAWEIGRLDDRYTTEESGSVQMYTVDGYDQLLTFGQLMIAIGCRQAAVLEKRSVMRMNELGKTTRKMDELSQVLAAVTGATDESMTFGAFKVTLLDGQQVLLRRWLEDVCDISQDTQPKRSANMTPETKLKLSELIKTKMEQAAQTSQQDNVELRSLVTARDVTYRTVSGLVRAYCGTAMNTTEGYC